MSASMNATWVSVMLIGNLQLECGLLTKFSRGFPFFVFERSACNFISVVTFLHGLKTT